MLVARFLGSFTEGNVVKENRLVGLYFASPFGEMSNLIELKSYGSRGFDAFFCLFFLDNLPFCLFWVLSKVVKDLTSRQ